MASERCPRGVRPPRPRWAVRCSAAVKTSSASPPSKLKLWGITQGQIDEILRTGKADYRMPIVAPIGGVVVRKNVVEGQYVAEGDPLFEIADLSHVWIQAQVYEDQVGLVRVGQPVEATVEAYPGEVFKGQVAFKDPALNPATRTMNVRYDLENTDGRLQPGHVRHRDAPDAPGRDAPVSHPGCLGQRPRRTTRTTPAR